MSLASGTIKLAPVRMGDLVAAGDGSAGPNGVKQAYLAPHLRGAAPLEAQDGSTKADTSSFPCLGAKPKPKTVWQKVTPVAAAALVPPTAPVAVPPTGPVATQNYKATVDACLEKERLTEAEKNKQPETDFNKMTREEKEAAGWTILPMNRASMLAFLDRLEEKEFPECTGNFTFAEMAALCSNYEKRVVKEMNFYRDKGFKV